MPQAGVRRRTQCEAPISPRGRGDCKGGRGAPLSPFTDTVVSCSAKHKVNGISHSTAKHQVNGILSKTNHHYSPPMSRCRSLWVNNKMPGKYHQLLFYLPALIFIFPMARCAITVRRCSLSVRSYLFKMKGFILILYKTSHYLIGMALAN